MGTWFYEMFDKGGSVMYVIAVFSVLAMAISIERAFYILFRYNIDGPAFMKKLQKLVEARNYDRAIQLCNAAPNAALSRVLRAGLLKAGRDQREVQNAVDESALELLPLLQKRTGYLQVIANVSTLLGLLGTIIGIIDSFRAVAQVEASQRQQALMKGIYVALYTTAFGLMVAVPTLVAHAVIDARTVKIIDEIDEFSVKLINLLGAMKTESDKKVR
ncbi:MAG: MotA/TolQ/ExbB proton channel family protein [Myxococcales bacterium]|nr:MotA/TolQ/ExbB proton channel family protein [Myxococcales bacterium]